MKRSFLQSLGIEDKEIIDKIMDENSSDIGKAKGELETYKNKVTELEGKITTKDNELETLKKSVGDTTALSDQIEQLKKDNQDLTDQLNNKVIQLQKAHAIENGVRDAKAKNVKAVMALLDTDKITFNEGKIEGLSEQIEKLTTGEDTAFLFGEAKQSPAGTEPKNNPAGTNHNPPTGKSFAEAIAAAIKN